jgi:hypothetical protein
MRPSISSTVTPFTSLSTILSATFAPPENSKLDLQFGEAGMPHLAAASDDQ